MSHRYYVVGDHDVWMIQFDNADHAPLAAHDEAVALAIDAAKKLGNRSECAHVCVVDNHGRFRSKWNYGHGAHPPHELRQHRATVVQVD